MIPSGMPTRDDRPEAGEWPPKVNPFTFAKQWYFYDETGAQHGPYPSQRTALKHLLRYIDYLENGPTLWQRLWYKIVEFVRA